MEAQSTLAALMADGPLPSGMRGDPAPPPVPPRFCGFPDPGEEDDGGIGMPVDGGVPMPTPGGRGSIPGRPPVMGTAGAAAPGGGTAGAISMPPAGRGGVAGFPAPGGGSCESVPMGFWRFDDCNIERTELGDDSNEGHTAFRNVDLQCTPSQEGLAVTLARKGDLVYVPDQPSFALDQGVTVAAWVNPDRVDRTQTIFRKRDDKNSSIALMIDNKKFKFIIQLDTGKFASVVAPADARKWTHVAATFDGAYLRLYKDGIEVRSEIAEGIIERGVGPLLMGNDIEERRLHGSMDNAWFNTLAAPPETIFALTCLRQDPIVSVNPAVSAPAAPGTTLPFALNIENNNSASCPPSVYFSFSNSDAELSVEPFFANTTIASGQTGTLSFNVTSGEETEPGDYGIFFEVVEDPFTRGRTFTAQATYVVAPPSGCHVMSSRALTIRDVSVVDDPIRTSMDGPANDPRTGAWAFGRMMERLSPTAASAPDVTEDMFRSFLSPQQINGFTVQPRPAMDPVVLQPWPRTANGKLDLARAPLRLLAIVNRLDLKDLAQGKAGEGRIVYGVLDQGFSLEFTVILEYLLPANNEAEYRQWAEAFHALQELPFPSEQYNDALQAITDRFTARNAVPGMPNGSALIDIRTNEIALSFQWELREFRISPATGFMQPATVFLTPDASFNFDPKLARFINANEASILTETHVVPESFEGDPFLGGSVFNNIDFWDAPGIENPEARHKFSLNTCNGCHGAETNTSFLQIFPREVGQRSQLSPFQTGTTVFDPVTGDPRRLSELSRRRALLEAVVCNEP